MNNQLIKQLEQQALDIVASQRIDRHGQTERWWHPDNFNREFARLIVQQCVDVCKQAGSESEQTFNDCVADNFPAAALVARGAKVQAEKLAETIMQRFF